MFAPAVVDEASTVRVLTTEWVDGERLDRAANASDVPRLCSVAMIAYLSMIDRYVLFSFFVGFALSEYGQCHPRLR